MKNFFKKLSGLDKMACVNSQNKELEDEIEDEEELENKIEDEEELEDEEIIENETEKSSFDTPYAEATEGKEEEKQWLQEDYEEGQLSIDVYQTPNTIVVKSTIAGIKPEDIDISINNDMLTIRGKREMYEKIRDEHYLFRECYWGSFSRSIILPMEIEAEKIEAFLENGVLTIILPKAKSAQQISIKVREK